jgi:hypothetical protein
MSTVIGAAAVRACMCVCVYGERLQCGEQTLTEGDGSD